MKLYVCWGTFQVPAIREHPCKVAHDALLAAGHRPEVVKSYGFGAFPAALNITTGRREVKRLTGQSWVPVLVTDDGEAIQASQAIVAWAAEHPAAAASATGTTGAAGA